MQHLSKLIIFLITLLCCSMPLFGMSQLDEDLSRHDDAELFEEDVPTILATPDDNPALPETVYERFLRKSREYDIYWTDVKTGTIDYTQIKLEEWDAHAAEWQEKYGVKQKSSKSFFSYVKWGGLCAGIAGLAYYLYSHKNKPVTQ